MSFSESHYVTAVDGIRLHIRIKGVLRDRPPLLYLHGGPGGGMNLAAFETCAGPYLEPHFPVAYLHQRGVLRSRGPGKTNQSLALHIQDIRTASTFLRRRFQQPRFYLLGHSWGGFTGCAYLCRHASTVSGFVAICPVVSFPHVQQELYALVSKIVATHGDPTAHRELSSIGRPPYPDIDDFIRLQGLAAEALGNPYQSISARELAKHTGYTVDADHCLAVQTQIAASLWPELFTLDLTASLEKLSTPLLMVACGMDAAVPLTSVESAFNAYGRSRPGVTKQWLLLESANHLPFTETANTQRCMDGLLDFLKGPRNTQETKREPQ
ncbi:MAG: alpha/beta hydrolase [Desulfobacteraceae bacterium]